VLLVGLADAAVIENGLLGASGWIQYIPPRIWVVSPLCWAVVAAGLSIPALLVSRRHYALIVVVGLIVSFAAIRLHGQPMRRLLPGAAVMVLFCGAAVMFARRWNTERRPGSAWLVMVVLLGCVLSACVHPETSAGNRPGAPASSPDVLVVFLDTVPYTSLFPRAGESDPSMPALSKFARESVVFDRAYTPSPWTLPAHFAAVTGLPAHELGLDFDHQKYERPDLTLAEIFRRKGYRTAAVISNSFLNRGTDFERGFDRFEQAGNALDVCRTAPGALADRHWPWFAASVCNWSAQEVTDRALSDLRRHDGPLFLVLNYMDGHDPYYVEKKCRDGNATPPADDRHAHLAALRCIDRSLDLLFRVTLKRNPHAVIAVLADHGEQFGEHGLTHHGNSLYTQLLHVPLMVRAPAMTPRHISDPVSIAILGQWITAAGEGPQITSSSVVSHLILPSSLGGTRSWSVIRGSLHLISRDDREELYDVVHDPLEVTNLIAAGAMSQPLVELHAELARARAAVSGPQKGFRSIGYVH